ncbi:uncharacterized protein LOC141812924 isoform X2 [Curcuma longa]|uniref:uncharacterized protein LOC141812924 isoform X2 n=1 Tax=Curcuma longa TaxID=136217 RepID=UPI003D9E2DA4
MEEKAINFKNLSSREYQGHKKKVHSVAWNCPGTKLASGSVDHTARVWNIDAHGHTVWINYAGTLRILMLLQLQQGTRLFDFGMLGVNYSLYVGSAHSLVSLWGVSDIFCIRTFTKLEKESTMDKC